MPVSVVYLFFGAIDFGNYFMVILETVPRQWWAKVLLHLGFQQQMFVFLPKRFHNEFVHLL